MKNKLEYKRLNNMKKDSAILLQSLFSFFPTVRGNFSPLIMLYCPVCIRENRWRNKRPELALSVEQINKTINNHQPVNRLLISIQTGNPDFSIIKKL